MTAPLTDTLNQVTALLNVNEPGFSLTGWTAVKTFSPADLTDLDAIKAAGLQVLVSPGDQETQRGARWGFQDFPQCSIQIIDKIDPEAVEAYCEALLDFGEEIKNLILKTPLVIGELKPVSGIWAPAYGPALVNEALVYASIFVITYRKDYTL